MAEQPQQSQQTPERNAQQQRKMRRTINIIGAVVAVVVVAVLLKALLTPAASSTPAANATPGPAAPEINHYAPNVTLLDLSNNSVALSTLRGKVVVFNFWYVACEPCRFEMPALEKAYLANRSKGLVVVGVDVVDDAQTISTFTQALGVTYPILRDVGQGAAVTYRVTATPSTFFIDRNGVIRYKVVGPLTTAQLNQDTTALLAQK